MRLRRATIEDLAAVESLLAANDLPVQGVAENFSHFLVADERGLVVGVIGLEKFATAALLRSAVVSSDFRGTGIGQQLVERLLQYASSDGIEDLYLLTTTAQEYFPKFGFVPTARSAVPDEVKSSVEFHGACPDTAVVMTRRLGREVKAAE
jgi:amino-acid N-acetyltransferase